MIRNFELLAAEFAWILLYKKVSFKKKKENALEKENWIEGPA